MSKEELNIYQKIIAIRKEFKEKDIKKSGENTFQKFKYHELSDIVPHATDLCEKYGLYTHPNIGTPFQPDFASLIVIDANSGKKVVYYLKIPDISNEGGFNGKIQDTGKMETYVRRYLYMLFLDIAIPDEVDSQDTRTGKSGKSRRSSRR